MAERTLAERLQPSLLDRLTDDAPETQKEGRDARVIDVSRLREIIQRDLSMLLNTTDHSDLIDPKNYPHAAKSVVNFGIRETSGAFSTMERARLIQRSIADAVAVFEPRIVDGSVMVELRSEERSGEMQIEFDIRAVMWAQPMPLELYLRSRVDVTTGEVAIERN
ncbi:type VI secretion system baseplate subunit TssE [Ruegeria sp. 2205SS24-7]|uniref:type VI secretion system baseplate subunit TssE n=1 Tax=Ruegeria discodermiae TaxID=3064389 RepID=UPI0027423B29|nr:type VI secretion system baseplate subunit TssE [Ruegeria sp. 2205SS24-7]MDP5217217.1 type VI secretion system baseplate subunit TssE [Ruegeria sp. 2205SS24-7]